ncbi:MAG: S-adenosyl-l-methionine hydroxide adenosyltransferase [Cytophagales bacterium CG12_big_fil_rev_8_21_14_0_65_40_12]|nr:MAG: S-adenosyl-l-methionine hydroxide adenosyltransferase [Cytophagales bacterium CG12_big_fil_rev_8_21_14_0_65_40_12]PIW05699.1 MAG: S-adenosyl-l-methionine hydroxide adenosyltransferase [Cytophagales bacterium CG17_big_fil_post_rev_8_21_14_2_50_40_13]
MALVTFTSDFGHADHYVAAVKAGLLSKNSSLNIVDISHSIKPFDIAHMAFVVGAVFKDFPKGTVHVLGSNVGQADRGSYLAAKIEDHFFVAPNNGILSILGSKSPEIVTVLDTLAESTFPQRHEIIDAVIHLADNKELSQLGTETTDYVQLMLRQPRATRKEIAGHVIHVDHYGNLVTNIKKQDFDILSKSKNYKIVFGRDTANKVHISYHEVDPGEVVFLFNSLNLLEIAINQGNAAMLLGLNYDSPIAIQFEE